MTTKSLDELVKPDWMTEEQWQGTLHSVRSVEGIKQDAKAHVEAYIRTNGEEGYFRPGAPLPCLLLTTIGRKSGNQVVTPLNFVEQGENYLVVGSLAGNENDPLWALNLKNNPQAWVQVKASKWEAKVEQLSSEEREKVWPGLCKVMPMWEFFQQRTDRPFPVFLVTPTKDLSISGKPAVGA